ncbi:MAG: metallophosphoesterase [Pseudomonadota bacterium]|nr:metallophosphoesterase [Pseudomonadota bacterium]
MDLLKALGFRQRPAEGTPARGDRLLSMTDDLIDALRPTPAVALDDEGLPKRIVAIADTHGESRLFARLLQGLHGVDAAGDAALYLLGDLVDRGPDSRGCLDIASRILRERPASRIFLGNHDEWFLRFLKGDLSGDEALNWLSQGGSETIESYGLAADGDLSRVKDAVIETAPDHLTLLNEAEAIGLVGDFAFVHAGVDPAKPLDAQDPHDCVWIRAPFMRHEGPLSHVVVHGHTPQKGRRPTVTENRISIDTGACFVGTMTAVVIDRAAGSIDFYAVDRGGTFSEIAAHRLDRGFGTVLDRFGPSRPMAAKG